MEITGVAAQATRLSQAKNQQSLEVSALVRAKNVQKLEGDAAVKLIEAASVPNRTSGKGQLVDVYI